MSRALALIGYRGTGKSTVGRIVAERLGRRFLDADRELEARSGRTIASIFAEDGEAAFRDLEESILADLLAEPELVLATGGGVILRERNREALRRSAFVVWLVADPTHLADRLARNPAGRPALTPAGVAAEVIAVLHERAPLYRGAADAIIATNGRTPGEVARAVVAAWSAVEGRGPSRRPSDGTPRP